MTIITSLHGRRVGLGADGELILNKRSGEVIALGKSTTALLTSAQVLALFATPITVIAAAPAGYAHVVHRWAVHKPAGTAYAAIAVGEDLTLKYTNASGALAAAQMETTGFLDQTTAQTRIGAALGATGTTSGDVNAVAAAAVVAHLLVGEITTGDSDLYVRVWYDTIKLAFGLTD